MHKSVLLHEAIDGLEIKKGDIIVDGTLGGGGHIEEMIKKFGNSIRIVGIDLDSDAIERVKERLSSYKASTQYFEGSFRNIDTILDSLSLSSVNRVLLDIGLSSNQFEESGRGFSFQKDEPLLMTFKKDLTVNDLTAREILNHWEEESLESIIRGYGEERFAKRIARGIVKWREEKPIERTTDLVNIILNSTPTGYHHGRIHPATKTFQALRITVNDEIESLKAGVEKGFLRLAPKGRIAVISFHSLEDRIVKNFYKQMEGEGRGKRINKKPIIPTETEIKENPRSRSAKLRILEKI